MPLFIRKFGSPLYYSNDGLEAENRLNRRAADLNNKHNIYNPMLKKSIYRFFAATLASADIQM